MSPKSPNTAELHNSRLALAGRASNRGWRKSGYTRAIVSYLDVWGFKEYLKKTKYEEVGPALRAFGWSGGRRRPPALGPDPGTVRARFASDAAFRAVPLPPFPARLRYKEAKFIIGEIRCLARIQRWMLVEAGLFVRGGIAVGNVFVGKHVFGPGLVEAATLEEKEAKWPRVLLSKAVGERLDEATHSAAGRDELLEVENLFVPRSRGEMMDARPVQFTKTDVWDFGRYVAYLDFFESTPGEFYDPWRYAHLLKTHKRRLEAKLAEGPDIRTKIRPVVDYHNSTIGGLNEEGFWKLSAMHKDNLLVIP